MRVTSDSIFLCQFLGRGLVQHPDNNFVKHLRGGKVEDADPQSFLLCLNFLLPEGNFIAYFTPRFPGAGKDKKWGSDSVETDRLLQVRVFFLPYWLPNA